MIKLGNWELKDEDRLSAYKCLTFDTRDDDGERWVELDEIITYKVKDGYELSEVDIEHITSMIKQGVMSGEINDWDQI